MFFTSSVLEKCQENSKRIKGQRRTNRPDRAFITFAVGYSRGRGGARAAVLTFGLFLHHVESHTAVAPNNVRGKDLGAAWLVFIATVQEQKWRYASYHKTTIDNKINTQGNSFKVKRNNFPASFFSFAAASYIMIGTPTSRG